MPKNNQEQVTVPQSRNLATFPKLLTKKVGDNPYYLDVLVNLLKSIIQRQEIVQTTEEQYASGVNSLELKEAVFDAICGALSVKTTVDYVDYSVKLTQREFPELNNVSVEFVEYERGYGFLIMFDGYFNPKVYNRKSYKGCAVEIRILKNSSIKTRIVKRGERYKPDTSDFSNPEPLLSTSDWVDEG